MQRKMRRRAFTSHSSSNSIASTMIAWMLSFLVDKQRTVQGFVVKKRYDLTTQPHRTLLHMVASKKAAPVSTSTSDAIRGFLVGNVASNVSKFAVSRDKVRAVKSAVSQTVSGPEVALIAFFGWALCPLVRFLGTKLSSSSDDFEDTYYYRIAQLIGQFAQIGGVVYTLDVLTVVLSVLGFDVPKGFNVATAKILYLLWGSYRLAKFKKYLLIKKRGKAGMTNKVMNVAIAVVTALGVLDILSLHTGLAVNSIFALGGAGTLIVSLGSQNLASQIVNGLAIVSTGKFYEGEKVVIVNKDNKKTIGTVEKMSLTSIDIRASDETVMSVPNQQLAGQCVGNITRGKRSSVIQTVYFSYRDVEKIPQICNDIMANIQQKCPTLDTESRPFRVTLRDLKRHAEVGIEAYFKLPPYSAAYYENRQNVMKAIGDAANKNGVKFDIPAVTVEAASAELV